MTAVASVRDVHKRWGRTPALSGVTVDFEEGVTGLLGANGAGKTTLLGILLGLHAANSGTVSVLGEDPNQRGPAGRALLGYSPEVEALPPDTMAQDFVRLIAELHGMPKREALMHASEALVLVGLGEERLRPIGTMSTGQKQMVKLAQAIAHSPSLVFLDEPTSGLDPSQRNNALKLIRQIVDEFGINVILSSHLIGEVERICDHVVVLDGGKVSAAGSLADLRTEDAYLVVEVSDGAATLLDSLTRAKLSARARENLLFIEISTDETFDVVRDCLASSGVPVVRFGKQRASLHDLFAAKPANDRD